MAKKIIDIGSSPNKGDGDPLRTAFDKINENFTELYDANLSDPGNIGSDIVPATDSIFDLGSADKQWADIYVSDFIYLNGQRLEASATGAILVNGSAAQEVVDIKGSVFADDSTVLVDAVAGKVVGASEPSSFLAPQYTQAEIDNITPQPGLIVYNTTTGKFQGYAEDAFGDSIAAWADLH